MGNYNAPFGFRPARHGIGVGQRVNEYDIASGLAVDLAIGDVVKSDGANGITKAAAGDQILGVFLGWRLDNMDMASADFSGSQQGVIPFNKVWKSGSTYATGKIARATVADDPTEEFEVQTSGTINKAEVGTFVNLVDAAIDASYGVSRQTVGSAVGTQFRVERIIQKPQRQVDANNNTTGYDLSGPGQYALVIVKPIKHERSGVGTLSVAV